MADPSGVISLTAGATALAWKLYKQCRDSPGEYQELSNATKQLANILREVDDMMEDDPHVGLKRSDFIGTIRSCNSLLIDLRVCLDKYKSLGGQQRKLPDRVKWDQQEVKRLHEKISRNVQMLSMSMQRYNASTQVKVVRLLNDILEQLRKGQRKAQSVSSFAAARDGNEEEVWPDIVHDLSELGLDEDDAEENRELIIGILREAHVEGYCDSELGADDEPVPMALPQRQTTTETIPRIISHEPGPETIASSSPAPRIFDSPPSNSDRPDSMTSHDTTITSNLAAMHLQSARSRKYLAIFDPVASKIELEVKRQPNTLKDDINLAKRYWLEQDWANVKQRLLRLLVASELPHHRRPDLNPKLITFLLGVACTYSGDLETARLAFTSLLASDSSSRPMSPSLSPEASTAPSPGVELELDDAEIAAATWLGDICLMTDRGPDAALAHSMALYALKQKSAAVNNRASSVSPTRADTPPLLSLNRSALHRSSASSNTPAKSVHEQLIVSELHIAGIQLDHLDELVDNINSENYPHAGSVFEDVGILSDRSDALHVAFEAQLATGSISSAEYPLIKECKARVGNPKLYPTPGERRERSVIVPPTEIIPAEDRLTLKASRVGWPLAWNPRFSLCAPLYASEWFHNISTAPEDHLLSNSKALPILNTKQHIYNHTVGKDDAESLVANLRKWLSSVHIDYKEFPTELRCRPQPDHANRWPDIAVFAVSVFTMKSERFFKKSQHAFCLTHVMFWDGTFATGTEACEKQSFKALVQAFTTQCKEASASSRKTTMQRDISKYQDRYRVGSMVSI